jgi:hypothetical protein
MMPCCEAVVVTREIEVDSTTPSKDGLVGGSSQVSLSLEYLVDAGAASPSVTLTTVTDGTSATWSDTAPATGYTVQQAVLSVKPGTKLTLAVNNAMARVRWCETVCC